MNDEGAGGGPVYRDPSQLVRQLRRAMREQPLNADRSPAEIEPSSASKRQQPDPEAALEPEEIHEDRHLFDTPGAGVPIVPPSQVEPTTPVESLTSAGSVSPDLADPLVEPPYRPIPADPPRERPSAAKAELELQPEEPIAAAPGSPRRRPGARPIATVAALVLLVAAVPVLGWYGLQLVFSARGGRAVSTVNDPHAPGYLALITPTPTELMIQVDDQNQAVSLTLLSLTMQDKGGGTVVFIPMDTAVPVPGYGIDRLRTAYAVGGATALASAASQVLHMGFTQVVTVDPAKLTSLVTPLAPITINNPDAFSSGGNTFAAGQIELGAAQVPAYLTGRRSGESDLERLNRQSQFWTGWLSAVGASSSPDVVPGESSTGLGHFVRTLAAGPVTYETLPVSIDTDPLPDGLQLFHSDDGNARKLLTLAVPYPVGSGDQRATVRLLNGANGNSVPVGIVQAIVLGGGQISEMGNSRRFGAATTEIHYTDPSQKAAADRLNFALGRKAKVVLDDTGEDTVALTIVLGSDLVDDPPAALLPGAASG
jgi:hypothetical protein